MLSKKEIYFLIFPDFDFVGHWLLNIFLSFLHFLELVYYCQSECIYRKIRTPWVIAQCQSMPINADQNCSIDPNADQLRGISDQCQEFDRYWSAFGIDRGSPERYNNSIPFSRQTIFSEGQKRGFNLRDNAGMLWISLWIRSLQFSPSRRGAFYGFTMFFFLLFLLFLFCFFFRSVPENDWAWPSTCKSKWKVLFIMLWFHTELSFSWLVGDRWVRIMSSGILNSRGPSG